MNSDWDYALQSANEYSKNYAKALVSVLDTAWSVESYLKGREMPSDGATIANLTQQVLAHKQRLDEEAQR